MQLESRVYPNEVQLLRRGSLTCGHVAKWAYPTKYGLQDQLKTVALCRDVKNTDVADGLDSTPKSKAFYARRARGASRALWWP